MRRSNHLKWLILSLSLTGLVGCGLNQGMRAKKTSMSVEKFSSLYGELPNTKSGSQIVGVNLLSGESGDSVYARAKTRTDIFDGVRSHDVSQGERVRLIAEIETRDGSRLYLAQQDLELDLRDGYIGQAALAIVSDGDGSPSAVEETAATPVSENQVPVTPVSETVVPAPPAPAPALPQTGSCPDISFSYYESGTLKFHSKSIMGHPFRFPEGFANGQNMDKSGGYEWAYSLDFSSGLGAEAVAIKVENLSTGESFAESRVALDGTYGVQRVPFEKFIPRNEWYADKVRFNMAFLVSSEDRTPQAKDECVVDTELSSPIILDFSKDQDFKTLPLMVSKAKFDLDANGVKEQTGWLSKNTAFLALDRNGNGQIDNGRELFGNYTKLVGGELASNGYKALSELLVHGKDKSKIDKNNIMYDRLILWFDHNSDGTSQFNELMHLDQAGVTAIETDYDVVPDHEINNTPFANQVKFSSKYYGKHCPTQGCASYDVWFSTVTPVSRQALR